MAEIFSQDELNKMADMLNKGGVILYNDRKENPSIRFCNWCYPKIEPIQEKYPDRILVGGVCFNHMKQLAEESKK